MAHLGISFKRSTPVKPELEQDTPVKKKLHFADAEKDEADKISATLEPERASSGESAALGTKPSDASIAAPVSPLKKFKASNAGRRWSTVRAAIAMSAVQKLGEKNREN